MSKRPLGTVGERDTKRPKIAPEEKKDEDEVIYEPARIATSKVKLGLRWDFTPGKPAIDLDLQAHLFDNNGKFIDVVFYNHRNYNEGTIELSDDNRTGEGEDDDEVITIDLMKLLKGRRCRYVMFAVSAYNTGTFEDVRTAQASWQDDVSDHRLTWDVGMQGYHEAYVLATLFLDYEDRWHLWKIVKAGEGRDYKKIQPLLREVLKDVMKRALPFKHLKFFRIMANQDFLKRDYCVIVDKSASMKGKRWAEAQDALEVLAPHVVKHDPDGVQLYFFDSNWVKYCDIKTKALVAAIFNDEKPGTTTDLAKVLRAAFHDHFERPEDEKRPSTILVITDGEPNDQGAVQEAIEEASGKVRDQQDLSISFIQVGDDPAAEKWLQHLDDDLKEITGAPDIVDTLRHSELRGMTFKELIEKSIVD